MITKNQSKSVARVANRFNWENEQFSVKAASWSDDVGEIMKVRMSVFVKEQKVPAELEVDHIDPQAYHVIVHNERGLPVATGRLSSDGVIGRMAVLKPYRGRNIGHHVLLHLMRKAINKNHRIIELSAQTHAIGFYEKYGFSTVGRIFDDAGIPHQKMIYINKRTY
ncbi:MAG: GNAT family N-acetyltransferase [Balneolales bacterium]|nr:GNAT family N-acetyltransferase [Balneolales bacterium]